MRNIVRRHRWVRGSCVKCGLRRQEIWVLDAQGRPVTAVVWSRRSGAVCVLEFPVMKGPVPDPLPTRAVADMLPGVPRGGEPPCAAHD